MRVTTPDRETTRIKMRIVKKISMLSLDSWVQTTSLMYTR